MPVIDASVVVALSKLDDSLAGLAEIWRQRSRMDGETWHSPSLILPELAGSVSRTSQGSLDGDDVVAAFIDLPWVRIWPVTAELAQRSAHIASRLRIKGCDAVYVALAAQLDEVLVTFDREQSDRGRAMIRVLVPE